MNLGWTEILVILVVLLLFFGAAKLPKLGRAFGEGIREFKKSVKTDEQEQGDKIK